MNSDRLTTFTDGVIAIIITIMVLELPIPHGPGLSALTPIWPLLGAYALSFVNIGIFWNNHHHVLTLVEKIDGRVLWANLLLLFWLSLFPFVIRWIGEAHLSAEPVAAYGVVLTMASVAYVLLEKAVLAVDGQSAALAEALRRGLKELASFVLSVAGIALSFVWVWAAIGCYVAVAAIWFVPDRRVEEKVASQDPQS